MDSQNSMAEPASGGPMVKPNAPLPPQGFQPRPQGPPPSSRNSINNDPVGVPRPGQPLRRLDSRTSLGPPPSGSGQFVQLRPYGPPRPPGGSFPQPRSPQPGQPYPGGLPNQRFPQPPGVIRGVPPQAVHRPPFVGNQQAAYQQQPVRASNDPRFQRGPDIAPQNGPPGPRPGVSQESAHPRQLLRNDSSLSLQRQQFLSNEEIKQRQQPTRPRIVIERMADINESTADVDKPEGYLRRKKADAHDDDGENNDDDDDDVVMDREKPSPRHNGDGASVGLVNGSTKSPLTPRESDDAGKPSSVSRPGSTVMMEEKQDASSRPITPNVVTKTTREPADESSVPLFSQSVRPLSSAPIKIDDKEERKEEGLAGSRPPSTASNKFENASSPVVDDSNDKSTVDDKASRSSSSTTLMPERIEETKRSSSPSNNDAALVGSVERSSMKSSAGSSRSATPSHFQDAPENAQQQQQQQQEPPRARSKTPDKSRSGTPAGVLEPPGNAERESKSPSKTPDKSRSGTPAAPEEPAGNAEPESRTPSKTPDKSRSGTPADSESSVNAGRESKTPDKSRASTPAEREMLEVPGGTADKSRSSTPAGMESSNDEMEERDSEIRPRHDEIADNTSRIKRSRGPTSSLNSSPDVIVTDEGNDGSTMSPRPSTASQDKLPTRESTRTPPKSSDEGVKGFDNGQQRSLSSAGVRSSDSPRSSAGSVKQTDDEKKRTCFDDLAGVRKTPAPTSLAAPTTPRAQTPVKSPDEKILSRKSAGRKAVQNGSASESQANTVPTTNGVAESPTKSSTKEADKRSTAGSPTKSPSKSMKSLPRTPETPPSTAQDKKKVPMNKVQVGAAPSPNLKTVRSKIGSLDNASYKPGGGKVKIENRKLDFGSKAQPKIAAKNDKYTPSGGDKKISQVKLQWNAKSKIGSLENATYKPGGGDKKIETVKLDFKDKAKSKVGSKENAKHVPGGGGVKSATSPKTPQETKNDIPMQKVEIKAESKIGSLDNVKHKPGGGDKKIFNDRDYLRQTSSNVESLNGSGSQARTAVEDDRNPANDSKNGNEIPQPQPPPSTPIKTRNVTSPASTRVTPQAVRSGLARSPEAATPRKQFAQETEARSLANGRASKTPSPDATSGSDTPKGRSPRSPISPRPPSSLRVKSASDKSTSGGTSPGTPGKTPSPKQLRLPKLASSPIPQENPTEAPETRSKINLPKLIEPSSRVAY